MRNPMNRNSINSDSLISIQPGEYVRCGSEGKSIKKITRQMQGLVIKKSKAQSYPNPPEIFQVVLVDGDLINMWCGSE
jgi:hypothetical protein